MEAELNSFITTLITKAGLGGVPESFRAKYIEQLSNQVQQRIGVAMIQRLPTTALDSFSALTAGDASAEEIRQLFAQHVPDYEQVVQNTMQQFATEFLQDAAKLQALTKPAAV